MRNLIEGIRSKESSMRIRMKAYRELRPPAEEFSLRSSVGREREEVERRAVPSTTIVYVRLRRKEGGRTQVRVATAHCIRHTIHTT